MTMAGEAGSGMACSLIGSFRVANCANSASREAAVVVNGDRAQLAASCSHSEVSYLRIERMPEGRARGAALDIGGKALVARDDVGVLEDPEHRRHHQITSGESVAIEIGLVA